MNLADCSSKAEDVPDEGVCQYPENEEEKIAYLMHKLPVLGTLFNIYGKIGEGTFSSVFLATLKSSEKKQKFAVKHLVPTCHPKRIQRELQCLQEIGGTDFVVGLELCLRNAECVVFIMPYMKHDKFSDYVHDMSVGETREYMRALLTALRRVHKFNVIHRDVKPSNFLYDRCKKQYLLVDFGLAQHYTAESSPDLGTRPQTIDLQVAKRKRSDENNISGSVGSVKKPGEVRCYCFGKGRICSVCLLRPAQTAPRAGTPGFRAPEVLLKYPSQTPAIDIWASGVMMLCILSSTHPFFRAPDDCTALAEITSIFGSNRIQLCARKLGRKIVFSETIPEIDIMLLCQKLHKRTEFQHVEECAAGTSFKKGKIDNLYPSTAYDLLSKLLDPDYKTRITAEEALCHPFLNV